MSDESIARYQDEWVERFRQRYNLAPEQITPEVRADICNTLLCQFYVSNCAWKALGRAIVATWGGAWRRGRDSTREGR